MTGWPIPSYGLPALDSVGLVAADLTGDGRLDVALARNVGDVSVLPAQGDPGALGPATTFAAGRRPDAIAAADLNGDGAPDLVVGNAGTQVVSVLLGTGGGGFSNPVGYRSGSDPRAVVAADLNGDRRIDIAVANQGGKSVSALLNAPARPVLFALDASPSAFRVPPCAVRPGRHCRAATMLSFSLSGPASVRFSVRRGSHGPVVGHLTASGVTGANRLPFTARFSGRALRPGPLHPGRAAEQPPGRRASGHRPAAGPRMSAAQRRLLLALLVLAVPASARAAPVVAGPPGGGPDRIIAAPSGGRVAYATTGGGLFRTRNGGRSWRLVPERLGTRLNLFAVDPSRPSVVYASAGRSEAGERLVVSTDSGLRWRRLGRLHAPGLGPGWLVVDPRRPRTLYQELWGAIYRSADGGTSWRRIPLPRAGRGQALALDRRGIVVLGDEGLFRSLDRGRHWRRVHAGLSFVTALVADPARAGTLYAIRGVIAPFAAGIYRSRDGGATWTRMASGVFQNLVIDPRPPATLYATARGPDRLLRSTDAGATWQLASGGLAGDITAFALGGGRPGRLYLGTAPTGGTLGGTFVSTSRGSRWQPAGDGLVASTVLAATTAAGCPSRLYAATGVADSPAFGSHLFASRDGAHGWYAPAVAPPPAGGQYGAQLMLSSLTVDAGAPTIAYAGSNGGVWATIDGGRHWRGLGSGPALVGLVAADPRRPGTVYAAPSGDSYRTTPAALQVSRDRGASWAQTGLSLPGDVGVTAMAFDPRRPAVVYAAARAVVDDHPSPREGDGVYASADGGATWSPVSEGLGDRHILALALDPRRPATLYAATESHGMYRSANAGRSWRRAGPISPAVSGLAVDPRTSWLYAAARNLGDDRSGVFRSGDGGRSWTRVAASVIHPGLGVVAVTVDATGAYLDAATQGLGVVRIPLRSGPAPRCRSSTR